MHPDLGLVARRFEIDGQFIDAHAHDHGHIHDTYVARFRTPDGVRRYTFQRINEYVFRNVDDLMGNIGAVTEHLRTKVIAQGGDPERETLTLIRTINGGSYWRSEELGCWRAYDLIEGAQSFDEAASDEHLYEVAKAFGNFQRLLQDFPASSLAETIPYFHHTPRRFEAFARAVEADTANRAQSVDKDIAFVQQRQCVTGCLQELQESGGLPIRVTHNDTKINNVLVDDRTGKAVCVIDLDTVMPGLAAHDFGDLVRSGASISAEDEPDVSKAGLSLDAFDTIVRGYVRGAGDCLTRSELKHLHLGAHMITLELGMRFLTDYLQGDIYFKIHRPNQNLDRCRTQFRMVEDMERYEERMAAAVTRYSAQQKDDPNPG